LPTLLELAELFDVAPMTVRRAMDVLRAEGWVESIPRKGISVREGWGKPPAQFHLGLVVRESHCHEFTFPFILPWLLKGLREAFSGVPVQVSTLSCDEETAVEVISRARLDTGVDALLTTLTLPAETWEFVKSQQVPIVSIWSPQPGPCPMIRLDHRRTLEHAVQRLTAHGESKSMALITYTTPPENAVLREHFDEVAVGEHVVIPNESRLRYVDYSPVYRLMQEHQPAKLIASDETMAFHARRATVQQRIECKIVMLQCVTPGLVWPGDSYFDTRSFYEEASRLGGEILCKWLQTEKPPRKLQITRSLLPRLITAPEVVRVTEAD
jgi:DNA-binding LacI/PurR family transcriptional regulator